MPLYDYRCTGCGREVEVMHGIFATRPEACEACGGRMIKLLSAPTIHFKGSGWAKKDAAAASSKKAKPKASSSSSSDTSGSSSEAKSSAPSATDKPASSSTENKSSAATKAD